MSPYIQLNGIFDKKGYWQVTMMQRRVLSSLPVGGILWFRSVEPQRIGG
jgi:hypothetical protein